MMRARGARSIYAISTFGIAVAVASCSSVRPSAPAAPVSACVIGAAQPNSGDTLSVATTGLVDWAHAPVPTNNAERLAFAQVYETLIDVDCEGHVLPALAASWTLDATKSRITLSLRKGAMFWTGQPVTANDVIAAWRVTAAQSVPSARLARAIANGTSVVDDNTLIVSLPDTAWMLLASPALAIYKQQATARWPEGSGPYRIADQSAPGVFVLMPIASQSPYLASRRVPSGDPRDAIDAGSDVLVTDDPVAVSYANARNLIVVPLPWTRTYALAVPGGARKIIQGDSASLARRESLARDAVHVQARAAQSPYWWEAAPSCSATQDSLPVKAAELRSNRVVYRNDDPIARGLAERLVALDARSVSAGLAPNDFAHTLRDGGELAYVLDVPRVSLSSCRDVNELWSAAPWLASRADPGAQLVPLIDTRETAILSRTRASPTVDWSGTLRFAQKESRP